MEITNPAANSRLFQSLFKSNEHSILHSVLLLDLCGLLYFPYLGSTPFFNKGEPREALAVQDLVQRGEWSLFLLFLVWDFFKQNLLSDDDTLFLKLWFVVMFAFFSMSMGKRPDYLLPLYPALSILMAVWFYHHGAVSAEQTVRYRPAAIIAGSMGLLLLILSFYSPIEGFLKTKDHANLLFSENRDEIRDFDCGKDTAVVFDDMLDRSVPFYATLRVF